MTTRVMAAAVWCAVAATAGAAQETGDFRWSGPLAAGQRLEVKGVNGDVRAVAATGNAVVVTAAKRARRSDVDDVKIEVIEHDGGVTICAVYPTPRRAREENVCDVGDRWRSNNENNDVTVDFEVQVPAGVIFHGRTVNGEMSAEGLTADVEASTVNGNVRVSTRGIAQAATVNGSVYVAMGRADWAHDLEFSTVNGKIELTLPADLNAEVRASTVNGDMESDYPLTVRGRFGPRRWRGTIGDGGGGRILNLTTVNGEIRLRKAT